MDNQIRKLIRDEKVGVVISDKVWYTLHKIEDWLTA